MNSIYILIGKSSTGKDTLYRELMRDPSLKLRTVTACTTRPMRDGEKEGVQYHFVTEELFREMKNEGKVMEERCYQTVYGPWYYFTAIDDSFTESEDILLIGTIESFCSIRKFFENSTLEKKVVPLYVECDDKERLLRAIERESMREEPQYKEMCRRYIADCDDFSEEKLKEAGIKDRFKNDDLKECEKRISDYIKETGTM